MRLKNDENYYKKVKITYFIFKCVGCFLTKVFHHKYIKVTYPHLLLHIDRLEQFRINIQHLNFSIKNFKRFHNNFLLTILFPSF
jgi:hypothetical protein